MFRKISSILIAFMAWLPLYAQYDVTPFDSLAICSDNNFSTATDYVALSRFSINETQKSAFRKKQTNKTIQIGLPTGFEFNTDSGSVYTQASTDLVSISFLVFSDYIEVTVTIPNAGGENYIDTIFFDGFYVRATAAGTGDLYRGGSVGPGDFKIHSGADLPGDGSPNTAESLGYLSASGDMSLTGITVTQNETSNVAPGFINKQVIGIEVEVEGFCSNYNITDFDFSTAGEDGTDNVATTVTNAHVYYTGTSSTYSPTNLFGTYSSPNGAFTVSGNQTLVEGTNYFWLAYDIDVDANTGDKIDASCTSVTLDGLGEQSIASSSPTGSRLLSAYYSTASGNWGNSDNWALDVCGGDGTVDGTTPDANDAVIICTGDTITLDGDITVASVIIKDGGYVIDNSVNQKLSILEDLIVYGSGAITMTGNEELKISGNTTFLGSGTIDVGGLSTFEGNFDLAANTTYNQNGTGDFTCQGEYFTINGTLNFTSSASLAVNGSSTQIIDGSGSITSNNSNSEISIENSNKTIPSTANLIFQPRVVFNDHNISLTNNGIVTLQFNGVTNQGELDAQTNNNSWINGTGSTLNYGGLTDIFDFKGDLYASATNNTVNYNGAGNQNIITPSAATYYNLTTGSSGTKTVQGALDVNGNISIEGTSDFSSNGNDITLAGNWDNVSTFTPSTSKITFDGTSDQYINSASSQAESFYQLTINKSSGDVYMTANSDVTVTNSLDLTDGLIYIGTSNLIINATTTVLNYSNNSFVNTNSTGYLRKLWSSPGSFVYPVGDGTELSQFSLQIFSASFTAGAYAEINVSGNKYSETGTTENFIDRFWDLPVSGITSPTYNFTAYYLDGDVNGDESTVYAQKFDTEWKAFNLANTTNNTLSGNLATSFSKFGGFDELITLPVELTKFEAEQIDDYNYLTWETAAEINNSHFEVLRSIDGGAFEVIGTVEGAGSAIYTNYYQFWDDDLKPGTYLYQLRQVDYDGTSDLSEIRSIKVEKQFDFIAFPNPNTGHMLSVRINTDLHSDVDVEIYDVNGRLVHNANGIGERVDFSFEKELESGTYIIKVRSSNQLLTQKLIVQKSIN